MCVDRVCYDLQTLSVSPQSDQRLSHLRLAPLPRVEGQRLPAGGTVVVVCASSVGVDGDGDVCWCWL